MLPAALRLPAASPPRLHAEALPLIAIVLLAAALQPGSRTHAFSVSRQAAATLRLEPVASAFSQPVSASPCSSPTRATTGCSSWSKPG